MDNPKESASHHEKHQARVESWKRGADYLLGQCQGGFEQVFNLMIEEAAGLMRARPAPAPAAPVAVQVPEDVLAIAQGVYEDPDSHGDQYQMACALVNLAASAWKPDSKPSAGLLEAAKALLVRVDEIRMETKSGHIPMHEFANLRQAIAAEEERGAEDDLSIHTYPWKTTAARDLLEELDQLRKKLGHERDMRLRSDATMEAARKELEAGKLDAKILQLINESLGTAGSGNAAACLNEVRRLKKAEPSGDAKLAKLKSYFVNEIQTAMKARDCYDAGSPGHKEREVVADSFETALRWTERLLAEQPTTKNLLTDVQISSSEPAAERGEDGSWRLCFKGWLKRHKGGASSSVETLADLCAILVRRELERGGK